MGHVIFCVYKTSRTCVSQIAYVPEIQRQLEQCTVRLECARARVASAVAIKQNSTLARGRDVGGETQMSEDELHLYAFLEKTALQLASLRNRLPQVCFLNSR